ncbi:conserved hypothetical protein [Burkholderiales bacterium 8X]|nr:conserved hypothetical protein [Burkholderiales bacterium 8X]
MTQDAEAGKETPAVRGIDDRTDAANALADAVDGEATARPATAPALESPAFPRFVRILAVVLVVDLVAAGIWSFETLRSTTWSTPSLVLIGAAFLCIAWVGYWIVYSRTRLQGDTLTQTWLWDRKAEAAEVSQLKLVHWRALERLMAPRLLVRRRNGSMTWFNSADAALLVGFAERVAERMTKKSPGADDGAS